ncbi:MULTISPECIES: DUF4123 domain-containing protein [Stutzerimonas stutzeri subgroup]|uniref:DUF4123 domain-containing protein n=1 Tax=Stutzerimonas stutzeri CCUG 29243 TaxID=1196835 RepID=I4CZ57_STUST|nr:MULTISPECIES: DUF4123 domain-containing protein [Stutzerimonas stutzeri subgroup]AFM35364.1 hypothetical protein A458_20745 [Stutzerimonas stutzeri CCUG 29243]MCQ2038387.1 DUF4123 domain-containing protein [Stutzerimonas kunmingensis]
MSVQILAGLPNLSTPLFMLLELDEPLLQRIYQLEPDPRPEALFADTELGTHVEQGPWLIQLTPDSPLLSAYRQAPEQWPGVLLSSGRPVDELLAHLRAMLVVQFEGERKGILRYYDPQVASYLFAATEAVITWLGPIEQLFWHGPTWADRSENISHWRSLRSESTNHGAPPKGRLILDRMQIAALEQQQLEAFAYERWQEHSHAEFNQILGYMQQGIASGFDDEKSLGAYLEARLTYPQHLSHPQIASGQVQFRLQQLQSWLEATPAPSESQG